MEYRLDKKIVMNIYTSIKWQVLDTFVGHESVGVGARGLGAAATDAKPRQPKPREVWRKQPPASPPLHFPVPRVPPRLTLTCPLRPQSVQGAGAKGLVRRLK